MCDEKTQALADKLEILELIATWGYTAESKDPDGFANVFTEDGVLGEAVSRQAIRDSAAERMQKRTVQSRHFQTNTVFLELTADTARTRTMLLFTKKEPGASVPTIGTGIYWDEWCRTESGWRMVRRTTSVDM